MKRDEKGAINMLFTAVDKANWKENQWDKFLNLINDFKNEYNFTVTEVKCFPDNNFYFSLGGFSILFTRNGQGTWITLEANTSKTDFDEKYEFVFGRIRN